ncbi:type II/IV secretion system ATPase subunit [Natronolimnohabitans innermongolicus]|uniref:Type II secretion system protein E n=1 Tax=Natronolimnohabitans innermongolicus JCM 12255 TaxID=1227499 RepID=L9X4Z7_9EURY|nr:type II/IV secretion system ATPase subunit [Natronolimnohabitans innermongolicus]ELY56697.1 type II secretion system protein E [Natronolimnohabitans innermongolicus JCM 12255]
MSTGGVPRSLRGIVEELGLEEVLDGILPSEPDAGCACETAFDEDVLAVDATDCDGSLESAPACRRTVIERLKQRDATAITVRSNGLEYQYGERGTALLAAAGRFIELLGDRDERLAEAAATDPLAVAEEVRTRVGPIADVGVESGLTELGSEIDDYGDVLTPTVGLTIAYYYVDQTIADGARLRDVTDVETGSEVRIYDRPDDVPLYALDLLDLTVDDLEREILIDGYEAIAEGHVDGERAPSRAIERVTSEPVDPMLTSILAKHTNGYGVLEDLFADPRVSDVYATSPVENNPIRVVVDGESMATNIELTPKGAKALASRVRRTSGRAFSRANPTVDATADLHIGTDLRIAGVTDPVSKGTAFAFREQADDRFTLPGLVANGTMTDEVGAFLSVAVERNAAALVAGTRGAGKTTLLGTLLYELSPGTRTVVIEDTPELPVESLQSVGRDVQSLRTGTGEGPEITPAAALRTALRLGDGALVVGEIRGEEASVLYEAMRVGANANAVLGTIHGDGAHDVFERVVSDLEVPPSSFGATDLVVTVQAFETTNGRERRVARIEEVIGSGDEIRFEPLYEMGAERAEPTGRIDRGESRFVDAITGPDEEYADIRREIEHRRRRLAALSSDGRTAPDEVARAYADRSQDSE